MLVMSYHISLLRDLMSSYNKVLIQQELTVIKWIRRVISRMTQASVKEKITS